MTLVTGRVHFILSSYVNNMWMCACVRACDNDDGSLHWRFYFYYCYRLMFVRIASHGITSFRSCICDMHSVLNKFTSNNNEKWNIPNGIGTQSACMHCFLYSAHPFYRQSSPLGLFLQKNQQFDIAMMMRMCNYVYFHSNVYEKCKKRTERNGSRKKPTSRSKKIKLNKRHTDTKVYEQQHQQNTHRDGVAKNCKLYLAFPESLSLFHCLRFHREKFKKKQQTNHYYILRIYNWTNLYQLKSEKLCEKPHGLIFECEGTATRKKNTSNAYMCSVY